MNKERRGMLYGEGVYKRQTVRWRNNETILLLQGLSCIHFRV